MPLSLGNYLAGWGFVLGTIKKLLLSYRDLHWQGTEEAPFLKVCRHKYIKTFLKEVLSQSSYWHGTLIPWLRGWVMLWCWSISFDDFWYLFLSSECERNVSNATELAGNRSPASLWGNVSVTTQKWLNIAVYFQFSLVCVCKLMQLSSIWLQLSVTSSFPSIAAYPAAHFKTSSTQVISHSPTVFPFTPCPAPHPVHHFPHLHSPLPQLF